jgi:quinol monooxygenase YgiN
MHYVRMCVPTTITDKSRFAVLFSKLAEYVVNQEPTTLSYELAESDKEKNKVVVVERYVNKDSYILIHKRSPEFLEFREKMSEMDIEINGHSYMETNIGFVSNSLHGYHAGDKYQQL